MTKIENKYSKNDQFYFTIVKITMIDFGSQNEKSKMAPNCTNFCAGYLIRKTFDQKYALTSDTIVVKLR